MGKLIDLTGQRFGRLLVIERSGLVNGQSTWRCRCDCGNETITHSQSLRRGQARSCGCLGLEHHVKATTTHGKTNTRLYAIWRGMKKRCNNPNCKDYKHYGGRGISVCAEWSDNFQSFYDWAVKNGYREDLSIDRINVDGNYSPNNCRWVSGFKQASNRQNSVRVEIDGVEKTIPEWARSYGLAPQTVRRRYYKGVRGKELIKGCGGNG